MSTKTPDTKNLKAITATHEAETGSKLNQPKLTKRAQLVKLVSTNNGAELAQLSKKLGWQLHTTRAVISNLRKLGYAIDLNRSANSKPSRYRITSSPNAGSAE